MKKISTYALLALAVMASSCRKSLLNANSSSTSATASAGKAAPDGFTYRTTKDVSLNLTLSTNTSDALAGVVVSVYLPGATSPIYKGVTNKAGVLKGTITVPASVSTLTIDPAYVGLMRNATAVISSGNTISAVIGGKDGYSGDIQAQTIAAGTAGPAVLAVRGSAKAVTTGSTTYTYPSPYTSSAAAVLNTSTYPFALGRPAYLEATPDNISASLLSYVNASLPESVPVTTSHPAYLSSSATADINVTAASDVWITYVSEGAGNLNTLGYYTYTTGNPPTSVNDISKVTIIYPNASNYGSGGGLKPGDKVHLGTFSAGTSIGFVLISNAWSSSGINTANTKFYSDYLLNPETDASLKKHTVTLYDNVHNVLLVGFEDLNRQTGSDNDFNDVVFYASSNPITALSTINVPLVDKGGDSDGDGVLDALDAFPNDPTRAYVSYYPSQTGYATLAFEDNWPAKGDYDLNDLVINYRYTFTLNASNQVVDMTGTFTPTAAGATYHNGFGIQLPFAASAVSSVTGQQTISNYISFASNGVEAGQSKAVIIPFDNHEALIKNADGSAFINTVSGKSKVAASTATVKVTFASPVDVSGLTVSSINPFLISNLRRGYEIHLPGYAPTDKATPSLFGTVNDASVPSKGIYYISSANWPWALNFTSQFNYPAEGQIITSAYLHFSDWATSGGNSYTDWYSNTAGGYLDLSKVY